MKSTYKKIAAITAVPLVAMTMSSASAADMETKYDASTMMWLHITAANYLAEQDVIEDQSSEVENYNFTSNITRREMVKVAMNISGKTVADNCSGEFSDLDEDDFGCKYAEAALAEWYVSANAEFRPDDLITEAESLKMVMQVKWIDRDENSDWRLGYSSKAMSEWLISSQISLDSNAKRGWIFDTAALTYVDFKTMIDLNLGANASVDLDLDLGLMGSDEEMMEWNKMMEWDSMMEWDAMVQAGVMVGGAMMVPSKNIVENAIEADNVTTVVAAVKAADLAETLMGEGPFTVFAPTNEAFNGLPVGTVDTLLMAENKAQLAWILTYHVVAGAYTSNDLTDGLTLTTVNGADLEFTIDGWVLKINGYAMVETADVISSNGVTHVIDTVLMPEAE